VVFVSDMPEVEERSSEPPRTLEAANSDRLSQQMADLKKELEGMRRLSSGLLPLPQRAVTSARMARMLTELSRLMTSLRNWRATSSTRRKHGSPGCRERCALLRDRTERVPKCSGRRT